eukprot:1479579-Prymnesium_polylepis.1
MCLLCCLPTTHTGDTLHRAFFSCAVDASCAHGLHRSVCTWDDSARGAMSLLHSPTLTQSSLTLSQVQRRRNSESTPPTLLLRLLHHQTCHLSLP